MSMRSVELLVASAKKFLARAEFRIQLDELGHSLTSQSQTTRQRCGPL